MSLRQRGHWDPHIVYLKNRFYNCFWWENNSMKNVKMIIFKCGTKERNSLKFTAESGWCRGYFFRPDAPVVAPIFSRTWEAHFSKVTPEHFLGCHFRKSEANQIYNFNFINTGFFHVAVSPVLKISVIKMFPFLCWFWEFTMLISSASQGRGASLSIGGFVESHASTISEAEDKLNKNCSGKPRGYHRLQRRKPKLGQKVGSPGYMP
jgi:hypothetical protein